jgi:RimJ/RimL family protein N-acetyltransferase
VESSEGAPRGAPPRPIATDRLLLEPLRTEHAVELAPLLEDAALYTFTGDEPPSLDELRERYERQVRGPDDPSKRWLNWIVRDRATGEALGYVQATVDGHEATADVAWVIGAPHQGRGYAREAAGAMLERLRETGVLRFTAHIHPEHTASARVAAAIGLVTTDDVVDGEVRWEGAA